MNLRDLINDLSALAEQHGDRTVVAYGPRDELGEVGRVELIGDPEKAGPDDYVALLVAGHVKLRPPSL